MSTRGAAWHRIVIQKDRRILNESNIAMILGYDCVA